MEDWSAHAEREQERYLEGEKRLLDLDDPDGRQRQLTRMGNAAGGAGLAYLMQGQQEEAARWLERAAERYRDSLPDAPAGSWGRPIGAIKARLLAGDWPNAVEEAHWTLGLGAAEAESPIGRYAACLALLVLERDQEARALADGLRTGGDFPAAVGDALATIAAEDPLGYVEAIEAVLESFETRDEYLEDIPVADTVMILQTLAAPRDLAAHLESPLLPSSST